MTVAKYVTVYKQKGGAGSTGQRNTKRFWSARDGFLDEPMKEALKAGDFFFSTSYGLIEVLQLCRKKSFVHMVDELANVNYIGIPYRRLEEGQVHYASPDFTMRCYMSLASTYLQKVIILV